MTSQAAGPSWRSLPFFTQAQVKDVNDAALTPEVFRTPAEISTIISSSHGIMVADIHGAVHLLKHDLDPFVSWQAHVEGRVTHMIERKGVLVTLGEEKSSRLPLLKIWDLDHRDKSSNAPQLLRSVKVQHGSRPDPVTTVALSASLSYLAIGLGDGTVLLYRHLDQSIFSGSASLTALPKPKTIHESPTEPITGLGFREPLTVDSSRLHSHSHNDHPIPITEPESTKSGKEKEKDAALVLFVVTTNRVLAYIASGKGSGGTPAVVDEVGCGLGCATLYGRSDIGSGQEMALARDDAIYMCTPEGRGGCYVIEWPKISATAFRHYLIIVSPPFFPSISSNSATVRNYVSRTGPGATSVDVSKLTILDMENKLTAFSESTFTEGVRDVFCDSEGSSVYVLGNDGKLFRLEEKTASQKLSILFSKSLYPTAVALAKSEELGEEEVAMIHKKYGDHLYAKGYFEDATTNYVQTLGWVQPSYVIRKMEPTLNPDFQRLQFLDAQQIHNLATYLQELHARGLANSDHTTLLLNTYAKLRDVSRLDEFIKSAERENGSASRSKHQTRRSGRTKSAAQLDKLPFDLDTAIRVCRQAGYFEHAAYLARMYEKHDDYLRIQIEDVDAGSEGGIEGVRNAVVYLRELGPEKASVHLAKYGRTLLFKLPDETTQLLVEICSGVRDLLAPQSTHGGVHETPNGGQHARQSSTTSGGGIPYLSLLNYGRLGGAPTEHAEQSSSTQDAEKETTSTDGETMLGASVAVSSANYHLLPQSSYSPPRPSQFFAHFVDHRSHFIQFLEAIAERRWGQVIPLDRTKGSILKNGVPQSPSPVVDRDDRAEQTAVWNTLLELYLSSALEIEIEGTSTSSFSSDPNSRDGEAVLKQRAMYVLEHEDILPYDRTHALILCSTHSFMEGLLRLWEKMGMYEEVLRFWMDRENQNRPISLSGKTPSARVVECLDLYGPQHHYLYPLVLRFLTSSPALLSRHSSDLKRILELVDAEGIISPIGVVQILSRNDVASVGLVKEWLMRRITESRENIEADKGLIESYRSETKTKLREIASQSDSENPKVFQATRCSVCGGQLDLPAVHFMCNHSYHSRCLNDHEDDCPVCARDHALVRDIRRDNETVSAQHELFLYAVENEGFSAIASAYSKGILGGGVETTA